MESTFQTGVGNFWVALSNGSVVGTIGIVDIGDRQVALKKMFVKKEFRGKEVGVAQSLMDKVKHWCREHSVQRIYLGTINAMV
ncbi:GNAT family N-acetyltransferase, partial [Mycobacterium tuberculosis]|uniref:GNAT family N-acetyltransferase n=1 Tax=Mycobacterium tuberculosis TaxID=1773 RepID=UPI0034D1BE50